MHGLVLSQMTVINDYCTKIFRQLCLKVDVAGITSPVACKWVACNYDFVDGAGLREEP